jgi:biopolymer transport protein TolR
MAMNLSSSGGRRGRSRRVPMAEINVTPFVDVMLVLLIIFMVTAPLLKAGVPVDLPDSRAKALGDDKDEIVLSLTADGQMFLDDMALAPGELPDRLSAYERNAEGKLPGVTLRADKGLDYGRVMAVMGELNRAGFTAIALVTNAATPVTETVTSGSGAGQ